MQHVQSEQHDGRPHDLEDSGFKRQHPNPSPHSSCQGFRKITNKLWMMAQLFRVVQDRLQFKLEMSESQRKLNLLCVLGEPLRDYGTKEGVQFQTSHGELHECEFSGDGCKDSNSTNEEEVLTLEFQPRGGEELIKDGVATKKIAKQLHETQGFNNVRGSLVHVSWRCLKQWYWM